MGARTGQKLNSPNDIVVKSGGSIYFTDPSNRMHLVGHQGEDLQKHLDFEGVYKLNPDDLTLTFLSYEMTLPNGLCFSPDESLLYVNDTTEYYIKGYDEGSDGTLMSRAERKWLIRQFGESLRQG